MIMNYIKQTYGENTTCDFKEAVERKQPKSWLKSTDVFTQFGYMEKRGSGLRKIRNETAKLPGFTNEKRPTFRSQYESFFTEILNNNYSDESQGKVQNDTHDVVKDVAKELLLCIEADRFVTAEALAKKLSMSPRQVQRLLAQLQNDNLIKRKGGRKTGHWELLSTSDVSVNVVKENNDVVKDFSLNIKEKVDENVSANDIGVVKDVVKDVVKKEGDVVKELLLSIKADGFVTAETLAKKLSMSARQVQRLLAQLQKDNLITRKGGRKTGHWEVTCPPNVPQDVPQDGSINVAKKASKHR